MKKEIEKITFMTGPSWINCNEFYTNDRLILKSSGELIKQVLLNHESYDIHKRVVLEEKLKLKKEKVKEFFDWFVKIDLESELKNFMVCDGSLFEVKFYYLNHEVKRVYNFIGSRDEFGKELYKSFLDMVISSVEDENKEFYNNHFYFKDLENEEFSLLDIFDISFNTEIENAELFILNFKKDDVHLYLKVTDELMIIQFKTPQFKRDYKKDITLQSSQIFQEIINFIDWKNFKDRPIISGSKKCGYIKIDYAYNISQKFILYDSFFTDILFEFFKF